MNPLRCLLALLLISFFAYLNCFAHANPLDMNSDTIPKKFKGDDIVKLVEALNKGGIIKGVSGSHKWINGPYDKNDTDRIYAFKLDDGKIYANKSQIWVDKLSVSTRQTGFNEDHYLIRDMGKKESSYIGQNIFGAKTKVYSIVEKSYFLAPVGLKNGLGKLTGDFDGHKIGIIFICQPARYDIDGPDGAYVSHPGFGKGYAATFDSPSSYRPYFYSVRVVLRELWVFDRNSGTILLKHKY